MRYWKNYLILVLLLVFAKLLSGQEWPKVYGDIFHCYVEKIFEDYDKGLLICGSVLSNPNTFKYAWIIKTDINGNEMWNKKFRKGTNQFYLTSSDKSPDEGMVISGASASIDSQFDPVFFKFDVCGEPQWCTILYSSGYNGTNDVIAVPDGFIGLMRYYGEGEQYARISLVKLDQFGEPLWIQRLSQEDTLIFNEEGHQLMLTSSGNYLISGRCYYPALTPYIIMTDTFGFQIWDIKWSTAIGTAFQTIEHMPGIFYCVGYNFPPGFQNLPAIYKFDEDGNEIADYLILDDTINRGGAGSIMRINDSTLLTGLVWGSNNKEIIRSEILKIDTSVNIINRRLLLLEDQAATCLVHTSDNKILAAGNFVTDNNWDIYLWKMNENLEDDTLDTQPLTYDSLCPYEIQSDTVDLDCGVFVNIDELPTKEEYESTIKIHPNPAREWAVLTLPDVVAEGTVEVVVYDVFGRKVEKVVEVVPVNRILLLDVASYPAGMYVAVAMDKKGRRYTGKFVVVR